MKLFHKLKQWFKRSHHDATATELKKYETEATLDLPPVPTPEPKQATPKPKSNRKPGPKKQVPGHPAVKSNAPKGSTPKKTRTYNKPKPKAEDGR
jgi:hypothetical protein